MTGGIDTPMERIFALVADEYFSETMPEPWIYIQLTMLANIGALP